MKETIETGTSEKIPALEVLVAAVDENPIMLSEHMNLRTEAIICNQSRRCLYTDFEHQGREIRAFDFAERGVGLNRNNALMRARGEIVLFGDEDIVYDDDYEEKVLAEFRKNPKADLILFNVAATEDRRTYENTKSRRVRWYNYGRYPTYSVAARLDKLRRANVTFSLLFGGGARYGNGEDTLFLHDCLKKGLRLYKTPVSIGHEEKRESGDASTWFHGYNGKFFYDRGVLYRYLYGCMAVPFALRFLLVHRGKMCRELSLGKAFSLMREGIRDARR